MVHIIGTYLYSFVQFRCYQLASEDMIIFFQLSITMVQLIFYSLFPAYFTDLDNGCTYKVCKKVGRYK